jgi:hypothetical protein
MATSPKLQISVIPAKAGILERYKSRAYVALDSRFRGNDEFCRGFQKWFEKRMDSAYALEDKPLFVCGACYIGLFLCITS